MKLTFQRARALSLACAFLCTLPAAFGGPVTLGTNSIQNGDAEGGAGSVDGSFVGVPGWSTYGAFPLITAVNYSPTTGSFPALSEAPTPHGNNFFAGGPGSATSVATQYIDLTSLAALVDTGTLAFQLSGDLGGFSGQDDFARLNVYFVGDNGSLGSVQLFGPSASERGSNTEFLHRTTTGALPAGTRAIEFRLVLTRLAGDYNDGYADNLSFIVQDAGGAAVPEPASIGLMVVGGLGLLGLRRHIAVR